MKYCFFRNNTDIYIYLISLFSIAAMVFLPCCTSLAQSCRSDFLDQKEYEQMAAFAPGYIINQWETNRSIVDQKNSADSTGFLPAPTTKDDEFPQEGDTVPLKKKIGQAQKTEEAREFDFGSVKLVKVNNNKITEEFFNNGDNFTVFLNKGDQVEMWSIRAEGRGNPQIYFAAKFDGNYYLGEFSLWQVPIFIFPVIPSNPGREYFKYSVNVKGSRLFIYMRLDLEAGINIIRQREQLSRQSSGPLEREKRSMKFLYQGIGLFNAPFSGSLKKADSDTDNSENFSTVRPILENKQTQPPVYGQAQVSDDRETVGSCEPAGEVIDPDDASSVVPSCAVVLNEELVSEMIELASGPAILYVFEKIFAQIERVLDMINEFLVENVASDAEKWEMSASAVNARNMAGELIKKVLRDSDGTGDLSRELRGQPVLTAEDCIAQLNGLQDVYDSMHDILKRIRETQVYIVDADRLTRVLIVIPEKKPFNKEAPVFLPKEK